MKTVTIKVKAKTGEIDLVDLENQAKKHQKNLAAVMITYPSTYGIYEETVVNAIKIVHKYGGQVYMDGANMNAQVGFTSPGYLGADVCHLNLHKTFAIPHGGGGPGIGPICVKKHLAKFLPSHKVVDIGGCSLVNIAAGPWSSASIVTITYQYIAQLGKPGLQLSTLYALLNANYLMNLLKDKYKVVYRGINGRCAHEFIIDIKPFKEKTGVQARDVAKRLQDFGFHAPTVSFPIADTLMIEPTESEYKEELDRLAQALLKIREEIDLIEQGTYTKEDNPIVNSPHTQEDVTASEWKHCYSREVAAFPLPWVSQRGKYWPPVGRADEPYGDRNFCGKLNSCGNYFE